MPADPVVSPADTIRAALEALESFRAEFSEHYDPSERAEDLAALDALLAVGERDKAAECPAGDLCAINGGAIHCYFCRRNWPRDETWEQPFFDRPDLRQDDIETLREAGERDRRQIARLTEAVADKERQAGMLAAKCVRDLEFDLAEFYRGRAEAFHEIAAVLAGEEDARPRSLADERHAIFASAAALLAELRPWDAHGPKVKTACAALTLALAKLGAAGEGDTE